LRNFFLKSLQTATLRLFNEEPEGSYALDVISVFLQLTCICMQATNPNCFGAIILKDSKCIWKHVSLFHVRKETVQPGSTVQRAERTTGIAASSI